MLVQDLGSRAVGQEDEEEETKQAASTGMNMGMPNTTVQATPTPAFDLDSMLGGTIGQAQPAAMNQPAVGGGGLDPLADIFGGGPVAQPVQAQAAGIQPNVDPLGDIFGSGPVQAQPMAQPAATSVDPMADLFGGAPTSMPQAQPAQQPMADIFGVGATPMM